MKTRMLKKDLNHTTWTNPPKKPFKDDMLIATTLSDLCVTQKALQLSFFLFTLLFTVLGRTGKFFVDALSFVTVEACD